MSNPKEVYYHDCPALGPHTTLPRAMFMPKGGTEPSMLYHKCPFCSATAGEPITDRDEINRLLVEDADEAAEDDAAREAL